MEIIKIDDNLIICLGKCRVSLSGENGKNTNFKFMFIERFLTDIIQANYRANYLRNIKSFPGDDQTSRRRDKKRVVIASARTRGEEGLLMFGKHPPPLIKGDRNF